MILASVKSLLVRDLRRLSKEIETYQHEQQIWATGGQISNSAGNLCLHLVGNLNTFVGKELGGTSYVRDRDAEFSTKGVSRTELLKKIADTITVVETTLNAMDPARLEEDFPIVVFDKKETIEYMLLHLCTHLDYHLGQVNYHRRLLDK